MVTKIKTYNSASEANANKKLYELLKNCPISEEEFLDNLGLFLTPNLLSRILFMDYIYQKILETQGVVIEFGCRFGQNLSLFSALRGMYEPFNRLRKIIGFDTFEGFSSPHEKDGQSDVVSKNNYSTPKNYQVFLEKLLQEQEYKNPLPHIKKYELIKGDAAKEIELYLKKQPETIIALVYFDMDLYVPTRECLCNIRDRLTRGSIIAFDELNEPIFPGETLGLKEVFGLNRYAIRKFRYNTRASYIIID